MKVLIISSNSLPAAPTGPAYVAGAVRKAGHEVQIFECLHTHNLQGELVERLNEFQPEVIGVSIRLVFGDERDEQAYLGTRHTDLRPQVKEITDILRQNASAQIVVGGPGFSYYARDWLDYLDLDYGIRGEGEEAFPLFLQELEESGDIYTVPGCVFRKDGRYGSVPPFPVLEMDHQALPAYDLLDWGKYAERNITPAITTKRGCAFSCIYCPYNKLEGKRYRLKSPERVLQEARTIQQSTNSQRIMFCDNNFNAPVTHAQAICQVLTRENAGIQWGTGDLRPVGVTDEFCKLMEDSGCFYANLAFESASQAMLKSMRRGYTVLQVRSAIEALSRSKIPFGGSIMLGAPGETPQTVAETLSVVSEYEFPLGVWITIGIYLWTDYQDLVVEALKSGYLNNKKELFNGAIYLSPELPRAYLRELPERLQARPKTFVQFNKPNAAWTL